MLTGSSFCRPPCLPTCTYRHLTSSLLSLLSGLCCTANKVSLEELTGLLGLRWVASCGVPQELTRASHSTGVGKTSVAGFWIPEKPATPPPEAAEEGKPGPLQKAIKGFGRGRRWGKRGGGAARPNKDALLQQTCRDHSNRDVSPPTGPVQVPDGSPLRPLMPPFPLPCMATHAPVPTRTCVRSWLARIPSPPPSVLGGVHVFARIL